MLGSDRSSAPREQGAPAQGPPVIPGHLLLRPIAHGSYGEIWLARTELGAFRAVKIIRRAHFADTRPYSREFAGIQRYEPVSREHAGLVDVLQVGRDEAAGFFYYVMELADDAAAVRSSGAVQTSPHHSTTPPLEHPDSYTPLTLAQVIHQRQRLPAREVVEIGIILAEALSFLHSRRLVHRDVKPSNIIFVGGEPKLADVGLIADLGSPQSFVGTEGYIPPEGPGSAQADIYSLGKVLYEAATGKDRQQFPDLPTQLGEGHDDPALAELNEVLLRACESHPSARYSSAGQMAADLRLLQEGKSLRLARARQQRLRRLSVAAATLLGVVLVVGLIFVLNRQEVLLRESFDGPSINTNEWTKGQKEWPGLTNSGHRQFRIAQTNGELIVEARANHEGGNTTYGAAWVDLNHDLRRSPECRIELLLATTNLCGHAALSISDGSQPQDGWDSAAIPLIIYSAPRDHVQVRVDTWPIHQVAVVYPNADRPAQFDIIDLSRLKTWRLRCYACADSSTVSTNGLGGFRIQSVRVVEQNLGKAFIGHVINELTDRPVAGAMITDETGALLASSLENGAFMLSKRALGRRILAKHPTFAPSAAVLVSPDWPEYAHVEIRLRKDTFALGDVTDAIRYTNFQANCIGFWGTNLWVTGQIGTDFVLMPVDLETRHLTPPGISLGPHNQGFSAIVQCGSRLLTTSPFPRPMIYDLTSGKPSEVLEPKHPLDDTPLDWLWTAAFDGQYLWGLAVDKPRDRVGLHALDLDAGRVVKWMRSGDKNIAGLAWDADRRQFWLSSTDGQVYAVDRERSLSQGEVAEPVRERRFRGKYESLAFGNGCLWGLDRDRQRICKIKITD